MTSPSSDITTLLGRYAQGSEKALERLLPLVQKELRRIAGGMFRRERANHTLQPTALVNEAFLELLDQRQVTWRNRSHFFRVAALLMRRVLVAHARKHKAAKRGGNWVRLSLDEQLVGDSSDACDLVNLDRALKKLARENERQSRIVELRYFGGLSIEETAKTLRLSPRTVKRDWMAAKAWLYDELNRDERA